MAWWIIEHEDEFIDVIAQVLHENCNEPVAWYTAGRVVAALREFNFEIVPRPQAVRGAMATHLGQRNESDNPWAAGWNDCLAAIDAVSR